VERYRTDSEENKVREKGEGVDKARLFFPKKSSSECRKGEELSVREETNAKAIGREGEEI